MATLSSLSEQLSANNKENVIGHERTALAIDGLNNRFDGFFTFIKQQRLDALEDKREAKSAAIASGTGAMNKGYGKGMNLIIPGLNIGTLLAGLIAVAGAFAGLRGWEAKALKNIDKLGKAIRGLFPESLRKSIVTKFDSLRIRILKGFGFNMDLTATDPETGKRQLKTPLRTQIMERFVKLRTSILNMFGIGADGKPISLKDNKLVKFPTVAKIAEPFMKLIRPVIALGEGITGWLSGKGSKMLTFLSELGIVGKAGAALGAVGGAVAGVAKLAGKILWPIGVVMALFDGVKAYQEKEGSTFDKILAGAFGFIGDFIGAPLDLLKGGIVWLYRNALGLDVDDDGNIKGEGFAAAVGRALQGFSFEKMIKAIPEFFEKIFEKITDFFNDPIGVGKQVIGNLYQSIKNVFFGILKSIADYIPNAKKLFPDLYADDIARMNVEEAQNRVTKEQSQYNTAASNVDAKLSTISSLTEQIATLKATGNFKPAGMRRFFGGKTADQIKLDALESALHGARGQYGRSSDTLSQERAELAAAKAQLEAAKIQLQNVTNQTSVSTATQPILMTPGGTINSDDMVVTGAR
jgi:hypothetical protein